MIGRSRKISNPDMYVVSAFDCFNLGSDLNFNGGYRKLAHEIDKLSINVQLCITARIKL